MVRRSRVGSPRRAPARGALGALLAAGPGCAEEWRNADLQLDISGAAPSDEARARVCIEGVELHEEAVGAGMMGVPGLPLDRTLRVTVDLLTEDGSRHGRAGPVDLSADAPWIDVDYAFCTDACDACTRGEQDPVGDTAGLLAVRFQD